MSDDQVIEENVDEVSAEVVETPADGGVSQPETPEKPEIDVERLRAEYDLKLQRANEDLNKMKSTFQKRESELQRQYQEQQKALQQQMREIRLQGMDEEQRKKYEVEMQSEEMQSLQQQLQDLSQKNQEFAAMMDAQKFFLDKGVPANRLILNQGYDALVLSGWDVISEELQQYREAAAKPTTPKSPRKAAPDVVTDKASPSKGTTWKELRAKYGSDENIYQLIEQGLLDPSILPA